MSKTLRESYAQFKVVRDFFYTDARRQLVIELGSGPMKEWKIHPFRTIEEMEEIRSSLSSEHKEFAGFVHLEKQYRFFLCDENFARSVDLNTGKVVKFYRKQLKFID
jgi:hypothetical protein